MKAAQRDAKRALARQMRAMGLVPANSRGLGDGKLRHVAPLPVLDSTPAPTQQALQDVQAMLLRGGRQ